MGLFAKAISTLRSWSEREDGAPQVPPVPGRRHGSSNARDRDDDGGLAHLASTRSNDQSI